MNSTYFSSIIQLTDLNDFITPSLECIKPVEIQRVKGTSLPGEVKSRTSGKLVYEYEDGTEVKLTKPSISLSDCLACSGCITSAESVLITQQSCEELLKVLQDKSSKGIIVVVSICIQSRISLAEEYGLSEKDVDLKISGYLKGLGVDYVFDLQVAEDICMIELQKEFLERYNSHGKLPILSSSCPGWICYAEKSQGPEVLPFISLTKSPQQIMGTLVKTYFCKQLQLTPDKIYHVTIMPCFDKKLEASRQDFRSAVSDCPDVDCVVTTIEIASLIEGNREAFERSGKVPFDPPLSSTYDLPVTGKGSGSGGYCVQLLNFAARQILQIQEVTVKSKILRNNDFQEYFVEHENEVILRFAVANGFRNIQNVVQKVKKGKCPYQFVEIMACPSGCLNGGAQIRDKLDPKKRIARLEERFTQLPKILPEDDTVATELIKHLGPQNNSLRTNYHTIQPMETALTIKW